MSRLSLDWAFLRDAPGTGLHNVLVGVCRRTCSRFAISAQNRQSNNVEVIAQIVTAIKRLGMHGNLEIQTDGEPALIELAENVAAQRSGVTILTRTPPKDSKSNGLIERSVRALEEISRVIKLDLEHRLGSAVSVHEPIYAWLLRHCAMILNVQQSGLDGKTPHERLRGRPYRGELLKFGSRVMFKRSNKPFPWEAIDTKIYKNPQISDASWH